MRRSLTIIVFFFIYSVLFAQYPTMTMYVKDLWGNSKPVKEFVDTTNGNVTLFVFWRTCCPTNISMINTLLDLNNERDSPDKIKIILVSVDDIRSSNRVLPVVKTEGWTCEVIMDTNKDLAREMQVYIPPQWVAVNHTGTPIYRRKIMEGESDSEYYYNELITNLSNR